MLKHEETEILAPRKRPTKLPCARYNMEVCLNANCNNRIYRLTTAQQRKLDLAQRGRAEQCVPNVCDVAECKKRIYPDFIKLSFCIKAECPNLQRDKVQCRLKPKHKGKISLEHKHHTLRMHKGSSKGWHYRKL
jgi:hypothetical protein